MKQELWIKTDTGFWLVVENLTEYNLSKPMAKAALLEEIQRFQDQLIETK